MELTPTQLSGSLGDYKTIARNAIKSLIDEWDRDILESFEQNRRLRSLKVDSEIARNKQLITEDEILIPERVIDTALTREQGKFVDYFAKTPRSIVLSSLTNTTMNTATIEKDFTKRFRYPGWLTQHIIWTDSAGLHGWGWIEPVLDTSQPGHFRVKAHTPDRVLFHSDTEDVNDADYIVVFEYYTPRQLLLMEDPNNEEGEEKKFFNQEAVKTLLASNERKTTKNQRNTSTGSSKEYEDSFTPVRVEKVYFKNEIGEVQVAYAESNVIDDGWLRDPEPLTIGRIVKEQIHRTDDNEQPVLDPQTGQQVVDEELIDVVETDYPVVPFLYLIREFSQITESLGIAHREEARQDALTSMTTSFVTGLRRSTETYWVKDTPPGSVADETDDIGADEAQSDVRFKPNRLIKKRVKPFTLPSPDPMMMNAIGSLRAQAQEEIGAVNHAVFSNKSTRKTAAEVKSASAVDERLTQSQVIQLSTSYRLLLEKCFAIYRTRVEAGVLPVDELVVKLLAEGGTFVVKSAGDVDVVERGDKINSMLQMTELMLKTGAAVEFMKDLIRMMFPEESDRYIKAIDRQEVSAGLVQQLAAVLKTLIEQNPDIPGVQENMQQIQQLLQQAGALTASEQQQQQAGEPNAGEIQDRAAQ